MCTCIHPLTEKKKHTQTRAEPGCIPEPRSSASVQRRALQPQGDAPASSPARAGQAEHLAPRRGHPRPRPSTPTALLGGQGGFTHTPARSLPGITPASPRHRARHSHVSSGHSLRKCYISKQFLPAASHLIYIGVLSGYFVQTGLLYRGVGSPGK